jgi:phosphatidylserine/phosphatidylglycerophosphate/cardiolipin synthase-like enzyme
MHRTRQKGTPAWIAYLLAGGLLLAACSPFMEQPPAAATEDVAEQVVFRVFFTSPDQLERPEGIRALVESINQAQDSVRVAMYNLSLDEVGVALLAANRRGVEVQLVMETGSMDNLWTQRLLNAGIPIVGDGREGLMHNKFVIIDESEVWTGSLNLTGSGVSLDYNNLVQIHSAEAAANYTAEFTEMFADGAFGPDEGRDTPFPVLTLSGRRVEFYFAPDDHPAGRVLELVRGARKSIEMLAYSFTLDELGEALQEKQAGGVAVRIVCDEDQVRGQGAECPILQQAGLDVRLDGSEGLMHHKVIVIDGEVVLFGSFNFTRSANERNDENLVVVFDSGMAGLFQAEFERIYEQSHE